MTDTAPATDAREAPPGVRHSGQMRMADLFAAEWAGKFLHVHGLGWHVWDGRRWAEDRDGATQRAAKKTLARAIRTTADGDTTGLRRDVQRCESAPGLAGMLEIAGILTPLTAAPDSMNTDPYLLNVGNGTVDLRTGKLRPHDPADRITRVCGADYYPEVTGPEWDKFLTRILPNSDAREYLQRYMGVALLGKVVEHILLIAVGAGANGKSTLLNAVSHAVGDYALAAEPDLFMVRTGAHPTGEMDLMGRRLVTVSESERDRWIASATVKRLTGGDSIRARRMRKDYVEFRPSHTPILATNHLPRVPHDDPALWRRLRVVDFGVVIPPKERDSHLDARLAAESTAILTWAIQGYRDYAARGLAEPAAVLVATDTYRSESDAVARFVAEQCVASPGVRATTSTLHTAWETWARADGADPISGRAFGAALDRLGYAVRRDASGRWRPGIGLRSDAPDDGGRDDG